MLAVLHWNRKHLPDQRSELYQSVLEWLAAGCDVDTRTEPDEVANSRARDTEAGRRRRARAAICAGTAEQARAAETAHGAARDAEIDRAAGVEGSRVAQGVRAADRGVRSEEHTSELQSLR